MLAIAACLLAACSMDVAARPGATCGESCSDAGSARCDSNDCPAGEECDSPYGSCRLVTCGSRVACPRASNGAVQICDPYQQHCYDYGGACATVADCPIFDRTLENFANVTCSTRGYCSVQMIGNPAPASINCPVGIALVAPSLGQTIATDADVIFTWPWTASAMLLLVLDELPRDGQDPLDLALWGAAVPAGGQSVSLRWADGRMIVDGSWRSGVNPPPHSQPLYALAQEVRDGACIAASELVAFTVGSAWPNEGAACNDPGALPGSCYTPSHVQRCGPGRRCQILCLSTPDCPQGEQCGDEVAGQRVCVPM